MYALTFQLYVSIPLGPSQCVSICALRLDLFIRTSAERRSHWFEWRCEWRQQGVDFGGGGGFFFLTYLLFSSFLKLKMSRYKLFVSKNPFVSYHFPFFRGKKYFAPPFIKQLSYSLLQTCTLRITNVSRKKTSRTLALKFFVKVKWFWTRN